MPNSKAASSETEKKPRKAAAKPSYDQIALRAYQIYQERGCTPGDPMQDWLRAEQESLGTPAKPRRKSKVVSIAA
jgi:Protein of unknown function (DUF2934)